MPNEMFVPIERQEQNRGRLAAIGLFNNGQVNYNLFSPNVGQVQELAGGHSFLWTIRLQTQIATISVLKGQGYLTFEILTRKNLLDTWAYFFINI